MKNEATRPKSRFLATARLQQQVGEGDSPVTASTSTSSYQDGAEYGDGRDNSADTEPLGVSPVPPEESANIRSQEPTPVPAGTAGPRERLRACSRVVLVLAIIDAVVVLCGASAFTPLILMMWGPIAGYLSSNFQLRATYTFLFYYGLRVSWDVGWLLSGGITWIVVWVFLFADAAAFGLVYFYMALLRQCTAAEVAQLRDPNTAWASAFFPVRVDRTQSADYPLN